MYVGEGGVVILEILRGAHDLNEYRDYSCGLLSDP